MEKIIKDKFSEKYAILSSENDKVGKWNGELMDKKEKRLILLPNGVEYVDPLNYKIEANDFNDKFKPPMPYKSAIGVTVFGCNIINVHVNWQSSFRQLVNFLEQVKSKQNLIIIGDFNTSLDHINEYLTENNLNNDYMQTNGSRTK